MDTALTYTITPTLPESHCFDVLCLIPTPDPKGQVFSLPTWIPGSYMIRDFARHIVQIKAFSNGNEIAITQLDKSTWQCDKTSGVLRIQYRVFAWDLSPRGAYVDTTRAFFNGSRVFVKIHGQEDAICKVELLPPQSEQYRDWQVGTAMQPVTASLHGFGLYSAKNYDELIDHPVEMGQFTVLSFDACDVPHEILLTGKHFADTEKLCTDVKRLCETHLQFFGLPAPFSRYVFLVTILGDAYGGLEHRASCAIQCGRDALPKVGVSDMSEGYRALLGLFSHEYFHLWLVKRITPAAFRPYDLTKENYTRQLWIFEGITSYYDDLLLLRSGLVNVEGYLALLGQTVSRLWSMPGRQYQTLAAASFEAWTKFYQPDENAVNATISYYVKGAIVALLLDLKIRSETKHRFSLDDVMRFCWSQYQTNGGGLLEDAFEEIASRVTGVDLTQFFDAMLRSTEELPLIAVLSELGLEINATNTNQESKEEKNKQKSSIPSLGLRLKNDTEEVCVQSVLENGAAFLVGLAPNDNIIAIDHLKVTRANLESRLLSYKVGDKITLHALRRDHLMIFSPILQEAESNICTIKYPENLDSEKEQYLKRWLLDK